MMSWCTQCFLASRRTLKKTFSRHGRNGWKFSILNLYFVFREWHWHKKTDPLNNLLVSHVSTQEVCDLDNTCWNIWICLKVTVCFLSFENSPGYFMFYLHLGEQKWSFGGLHQLSIIGFGKWIEKYIFRQTHTHIYGGHKQNTEVEPLKGTK